MQISAVATVSEDYESRLVEVFPGQFHKLRVLVLDSYDLALRKLERNAEIVPRSRAARSASPGRWSSPT